MGARKSKSERIIEANLVHNNKYDYSLLPTKVGVHVQVDIICPIHGKFSQRLGHHINNKQGCPKCGSRKRAQTNLERYGAESFTKSSKFADKRKAKMLELFGTEHALQHPICVANKNSTNIERYGTTTPLSLDLFQDKRKTTNLERYGVEHPSQNPTILYKTKQTNLERYGVEYPNQHPDIRDKSRQTNLERYGVEYPNQQHVSQATLQKINDKSWLLHQHHKLKKPLMQIATELGDITGSVVTRYAHNHNIEIKHFYSSIGERQVRMFINALGFVSEDNTRLIIPPYELDIYVPEIDFAIEYNGNYWHGNNFPVTQSRDIIKQQECANRGIFLLTVWDADWNSNSDTLKEIITNITSVMCNKSQIKYKETYEI